MTTEQITSIIIPIAAALGGGIIGAIIASKNSRWIIKHNDKKFLLAQLMGYRHAGATEDDFVKALNMIVVIFHNNIRVKECLHRYLTATTGTMFSGGQRIRITEINLVLPM